MDNKLTQRNSIFLIGLILLIGGCSIQTEGLIPDEPIQISRQINKAVKVMPVSGGHASKFGREAYITNEQYQEALYQTLSESNLFTKVVKEGDVDWELNSEIITITTEAGLSPNYAIVVQYWLTDSQTGEEFWRKGINSRHQVQWNEAFAGGTRIIMAVEGATKKNLTRLVESLEAEEF